MSKIKFLIINIIMGIFLITIPKQAMLNGKNGGNVEINKDEYIAEYYKEKCIKIIKLIYNCLAFSPEERKFKKRNILCL